MSLRSRREHKPTSKFLNYFTQELSPTDENGKKNKSNCLPKNSTTLKANGRTPVMSAKKKLRTDEEVVTGLKQSRAAQPSTGSSSSSDTRRSNRAQKINPKFNGFINPVFGNSKRDQKSSKTVTVNLAAKPRPKNAVAAVSPMVRAEGIETPIKCSKHIKVGLVDCFEGLTNDLALMRGQHNSSDDSRNPNNATTSRLSGNSHRPNSVNRPTSLSNSEVSRGLRSGKSASVVGSSNLTNAQGKNTSKHSNRGPIVSNKSPTLRLRSRGRNVMINRKRVRSSTSSNENSQSVVKQLLSGETIRYVRPNPIVALPQNEAKTAKKSIVNRVGVRNSAKRPSNEHDGPSAKKRRLEPSFDRCSTNARINENSLTESVRKLLNQRSVRCNSVTVTRKQYPLRKPAVATVTLSSDDATSSTTTSSSSNPASPDSPLRPKTTSKQRLQKKSIQPSPSSTKGKKVTEKDPDQESQAIKETLKKFLIMGTKVANAISETLKHNEEALLAKSSAFEKKCLNLVHALAKQGDDLEEDDMEKVLQLLDEEQEERKQYRHTFLESLKVSHLTNMALYSQMLRLLKTL